MTPDRQRLADTLVRARNLVTGEIGGSTTTTASGGFVIDVEPGRYVLEVVDDGGLVIATSLFISAEAGATVSTAIVADGSLAQLAPPQAPPGETILDAPRGVISGILTTPDRRLLANTVVRARNLATEEIGESATTGSNGQFAINLNPGRYVLEVVDAGGEIIGTSEAVSVVAGVTVTSVIVANRAVPSSAAAQETGATGSAVLEGAVAGASQGGVDGTSGVISGIVFTPEGEPLANTGIRARNLLTGEIGGSTTTGPRGEYAMTVSPGSYVLEILDNDGVVIATSAFISAAAGATVTMATVAATPTALSAVGSVSSLAAVLGATTARGVAAAFAVAGITPVDPVASPSR